MNKLFDGIRRAYIALVQKFAPMWVVKNKVLKANRPFAYDWLMGSEKELKAIKALRLSAEEIKLRVWSNETRISLLKGNNYALIDDICLSEERDVVLENAKRYLADDMFTMSNNISADIVVKALKFSTPSAEGLKQIINCLGKASLVKVVDSFPKGFNDVKPFEVLGLPSLHSYTVGVSEKRWDVALILSKHNPKLSLEFMKLMLNAQEGSMSPQEKGIFESFFNIAFKSDQDMSPFIGRLYQEFPELYVELRKNANNNPHVGEYLHKMWDGLIKPFYNQSANVPNFTFATDNAKREDGVEAYYWLKIAKASLSNAKVMRILVGQLAFLKEKLDKSNFNFLITMLARTFHSADQAVKIMEYVESYDDIHGIRERLIKVATPDDLSLRFPFHDWSERQKKAAIKRLVEADKFPTERMGELEVEYQAFAKEAMLSRSQILILAKNDSAEWRSLFSIGNLTSEAEKFMLSSSSYLAKIKLEYIRQYGLTKQGFNHLLGMRAASFEQGYEYLLEYAKKKGLTEEQHLQVMQSIYAQRASYLLKYVNY